MIAACPFPANYGTPGAIREMSETLAERGHDVHVVTYPFGDELPVQGVKVWRTRYWRAKHEVYAGPSVEKVLLDLLLISEVCRVVRRERLSIIHAHNYEGALIGFIAKVITRRPLVYHAVSLMSDELPSYNFIRPAWLGVALSRLLDWMVLKIPDHFITVTEDLRKAFLDRGVAGGRVTVVPCGVKLTMFQQPNDQSLRGRYEISNRPVVMYTGVTSPFQRIDYLLRSFVEVLAAMPGALLMVVSPLSRDPDMPACRAMADALGIGANVLWIEGHLLSELPAYLALASVAVIPRPSVPGHPIKLLNYMAAGKPVVCFEGAAKGVQHMRDAYVVADHDWRELAVGIVRLLRDPQLAKRLSAAAQETVRKEFDWNRLCSVVESVYEPLLIDRVRRSRRVAKAERYGPRHGHRGVTFNRRGNAPQVGVDIISPETVDRVDLS
jgi:1,2-diacylglycerol 3-alpha-glucosyltransferase